MRKGVGKRGLMPKGKIKIKWSADFAYGIGLLATDGCLSSDGRHILFVSKDLEQIINFKKAFKIKNIKTGLSTSGQRKTNAHRVQFGDVLFYRFLEGIGLTPAKSKTIESVSIPDEYFFDFLRGCLDGDGYTYSYWDPRWKSSFMFYTGFVSSSRAYTKWLQQEIKSRLGINGHITKAKKKSWYYQLKYGKKDSIKIFRKIYKQKNNLFLNRKKLKIENALAIVGEHL